MMEPGYPFWSRTSAQVADDLAVKVKTGLSTSQVLERRGKYGYNELEKEPPTPLWKLVVQQFDDTLVKILLIAAVVSFVLAYFEEGAQEEGLRAYIEPFVILLILILNAIVGIWQESNAEKALEALKELQSDTARVLRDGLLVPDLPARELVPGDVVELTVGDRVPADIRIIQLKTATLRAEQASLTGESVAVLKSTSPVLDEKCELQGKECMLFASTAIANGHCTGIVTAIGMGTEIGKIQEQIQQAAAEEEDTPLKKKLDEFGELLAQVIFYICVLVWLINYHHFMTLKFQPGSFLPDWSQSSFNFAKCTYYFKIAVALAVAAIPEGLPAVITTCLALGTRKMAAKNAIVRKLPSVETLGCTTVICSDKTGTLTTNQMSVVRLVAPGGQTGALRTYEVSGVTYNPADGAVLGLTHLDAGLQAVSEVCALCNDSSLTRDSKTGQLKVLGLPTEAALKVLVEKLGTPGLGRLPAGESLEPACLAYANRLKKLATLEFDRHRKSMSVICADASRQKLLLVKGAAECVVDRCSRVLLQNGVEVPMTPELRSNILTAVEDMAASALRCLALARKSELPSLASWDGVSVHPELQDPANYERLETGCVFLGLVGLKDPPRPEVADSILQCRQAGIRVIVITGDNQKTAEAICKSIKVFEEHDDLVGKSFTGRAFSELSPSQQMQVLTGKDSRVFSRAEPRHKQDIVRLLKEMGEVTAMTGDGVNDAPALKLADIGVAMGIAGTEVAKEASDMVLADDNFSTIVAAVAEGRAIYNNMKAFIRYMISSNMGEVASIFITAALGLPEGLIPVQLLWVNLVTDGPPATALGFNPADDDIMTKPPRRSNDPLITPWVLVRYVVVGAYVGIATVGVFVIWYTQSSFLGIDLSQDGHTTVTWRQLSRWESCPTWENFEPPAFYTAGGRQVTWKTPCDYFTEGKAKASTLSLSVLVAIEMFNAMNALSEDHSLIQMPPWRNPWLAVAMAVSLGLHGVILYVPFLAEIFSIVPLSINELLLVVALAFPVILIDEVLKFLGRNFFGVQKVKLD